MSQTDFLFTAANVIPNTWVKLIDNISAREFISTAASNLSGQFTTAAPPGNYTVYTGPTSAGPWTSTGDANYRVPDTTNAPVFSVLNYGARGDDSTDDAVAFQAAITAAAAADGGVVFVPSAKYKIGSTLTVTHTQITIQGQGGEGGGTGHTGTRITFNGSGSLFEIGTDNGNPYDGNYYDGYEGFTLKDLTLDVVTNTVLDKGTQSFRTGTYGVRDWRGGSQFWQNVKVIGFDYTFWGVQSDLNRWDHVNVQNSHRGVYAGPRSDQFTFTDCYFINCDRAVEVDRSTPRFDRCTFVDNGAVGTNPIKIHSAWTYGQWGAVFDNCWFEHYIGPTPLEAWIEFAVGDTVQSSELQIIRPSILTNASGSGPHMQYLLKVGNATHILIEEPTAQIFNVGAPGTAGSIEGLVSCVAATSPDIKIRIPRSYTLSGSKFATVITSGGATPNTVVETWGSTTGWQVYSGQAVIGNDVLAVDSQLAVDGAAATNRQVTLQTAGVARWIFRGNNTAESGSNAGSDLQILARTDAGAILSTPLAITRSNSTVSLAGNLQVKGGSPWYDVKAFGATGDGSTNDTAAIQLAIDAAGSAGGEVFVPTGTYIVDFAGTVADAGNTLHYCLLMKASVILRLQTGATLKLKSSSAAGNDTLANNFYMMIVNQNAGTGGDEHMWVVGGTLDGNAANQTHTHGGLYYYRARWSGAVNVTAKNFRGTASSGANETFHFEYYAGSNGLFDNCVVLGTAGSTSSGFSADYATDVEWRNCHAYGMTVAQGFTHYGAAQMLYANCTSGLNGSHGFNSEMSDTVRYVSCIAGGVADGVAAGYLPYPFSSAQSLGNTTEGFQIKGDTPVGTDASAPENRVDLIGCQSRNNSSDGLIARNTTALKIIGGEYSSNTGQGVNLRGCTNPIILSVLAQRNTVNGLRATQSLTDATQTTKLLVIGGSYLNNNQSAAGAEGDGLFLTSTTTATLEGVAAYDNQGGKTQRYGVELAGSSRATIIGGDFQSNLTGTYLDTPALSWVAGNDQGGRQFLLDVSSLGIKTGGNTITLLHAASSNRNITLPDATDTLVGKNTTDILTNKTLTSPSVGGNLTMSDAASRLVPGVTSLSLRNNANSADNLIILDAGGATFRSTISSAFNMTLSGATATTRDIVLQTAGSNRWLIRMDNTAEGGSNAGSNFSIIARDDAGALLSTPITITRSSGLITFGEGINLAAGTTTGSQVGTTTSQKLAFHGSTAVIQRAGAAQVAAATTASTNAGPFGYTTAAQADAIVTLVNEIRATLVEKGLMKGAA